MHRPIMLFLCLLLASCQSLKGDDVPATMRVEMTAYATEAAQIQSQLVAGRTQVAATVVAAGTMAADYYHYNTALIGTLQAVIPPTASGMLAVQIPANGAGDPNQVNKTGGITQLSDAMLTSALDPETGCGQAAEQQFNITGIQTLYVAVHADNMQAGTRLEADWEFNGQIMHQTSWVAQASHVDICAALPVTPGEMEFLPGSWNVTLSVNEEPLMQLPFVLVQ